MSIEVPCPRSPSWEAAQLEFKGRQPGSLTDHCSTCLTLDVSESCPPPETMLLSSLPLHLLFALLGVASLPQASKNVTSSRKPSHPPSVLTQHSPTAL